MPTAKFNPREIPEGEGRIVEDGDRAFAVFNIQGQYYCIENSCPHRGGPLGDGYVEDGVVTCPWHGWEFDVQTGCNTANPEIAQASYPVRLNGPDEGEIEYPEGL